MYQGERGGLRMSVRACVDLGVSDLGTRPKRHLGSTPMGERSVDVGKLLARADCGDEDAWRALVAKFAGLVWSVARSFRLSEASTADVVQTVWLRLAEHTSRIREPDRLASWLATSTRHEALRVLRGTQRTVPRSDFADAHEPTASSIEDIISDDVTLHAVLAAFRQLPSADQQLLRLLCTVPPLDYQTIAVTLGRSVGSIGPSRARSIDKLRRLLPAGIDPKAGVR